MSRNTITIKGHGLNMDLDAGEFSGGLSLVATPRHLLETIERAYRAVVGRHDGAIAIQGGRSRCVQLGPNCFERRFAMFLMLYHSDGTISRPSASTARVFRVYCRQEFSE